MGVQIHDVFTVGIPVFVILTSILFNRSGVRPLEEKMDKRFNKIEACPDRLEAKIDRRFDIVHQDLNQFFRELIHVEGRIDTVEKRG